MFAISKDKEKQFKVVKWLMNRKDVTEIVNGCDAGREGELIFRNIIRYGHLTSYGLILDADILPWGNIRAIEFVPGEYRHVYRKGGGYMKYFPAEIKVTLQFGNKSITETKSLDNEDYDLSDEIARFLDSIPKYTEHKFEVINGYYYAK